MFVATVLLYPCVLAALCAGAGLAVDRCSGGFLPPALLLSVGAAALIALSQLSTDVPAIAPATPYLMAALALAGLALALGAGAGARAALRGRTRGRWRCRCSRTRSRSHPCCCGGRPSFSSYMALADSAVHLIGADFLIAPRPATSRTSTCTTPTASSSTTTTTPATRRARTRCSAAARSLLGLPLIWAFQPFNAFMLASRRRAVLAAGQSACAWRVAWAALAVLTRDPARARLRLRAARLGQGNHGSVDAPDASVRSWSRIAAGWAGHSTVRSRSRWCSPPGVSALGLAFGAWALAAVLVLAVAARRASCASGTSVPPRALARAGGRSRRSRC